MIKIFKPLVVAVSTALMLSGCCGVLDEAGLVDQTLLPPSYPADVPPPPKTNGTIYQRGYEVSLYQDHVATRVGDILTVRLEESTQGEKQAQMKTDKNSSFNTNAGTLMNNPSTEGGGPLRPVMFGGPTKGFIFNLGTESEFEGKGRTNQFNRLRGMVSVTVVRVLSNNNMIIQGESWITINQGREYIRLSGIVRPEDIETNNVVSSQRIANARIAYSGNGQVGNSARGGWITQFMTKFFPY